LYITLLIPIYYVYTLYTLYYVYKYYDIVILSVPIINVSYIIYRYAAGGIYNCQRPLSCTPITADRRIIIIAGIIII